MKFEHKLKTILFDLDGVLIRSEHLYHDAKRMVLQLHLGDPTLVDFALYQGQSDLAFFHAMKDKFPHLEPSAEALANQSAAIFQSTLFESMQPMPGAKDFILKSQSKKLQLANVTSATAESQKYALQMLGVIDCFQVLVNAEDVSHYKPHPEPYLLALKQLEADVTSCLVIEDTMSGIKSAKQAGLKVAAFGETFDMKVLLAAGADFYVESYEELMKVLDW